MKAAKRAESVPGGAEAEICSAVRQAILARRLSPGARLPELALGDSFGVSRTVVRQALRRLAHEGLVALRDRRVALVARPSPAEVAHVFAARRVVEAAVVRGAAVHGTRTELLALRRLVQAEERAYRFGERSDGLDLSLEFHRQLGRLCGNPVLEHFSAELLLRSSLAIALFERPDRAYAHAAHLTLVDAIVKRDAKRAERLMVQHLTELERDLRLDAEVESASLAEILSNKRRDRPSLAC